MSRKLVQPIDDESGEIIKRYENFLEGKAPGYFDVEELEAIVDYYLRKGKTTDSSRALELGLKLHPGSNELKTKRAKIYLASDETHKAMHILDSLGNTGEYEVYLLRIEALLKLLRNKEARQVAEQLMNAENDDLDNIALDIAFIFIAQFNFEDALFFLKKGDAFFNKNIDLLFELAFCYEQSSENEKAIETYNRIVDIDSYSSEAWFNMGQVYFALQDFKNAIDAYDFALAINGNDPLTTLQKAHAHFQNNEFNDAIDAYNEYAVFAIDKWQVHLFIGECYERLEIFDQAIMHYNASLTELPDNYEALTGLAVCYLEKEDFETSLRYVNEAIKIDAKQADAWVYMAEGLVGLNDIDNALLAYLEAIILDPNQPDTFMAIANICMDKMEYETALKYYLSAYDLDPALEHIDLFLAVAFCKTENYSKAKLHLRKAIEQDLDAGSLFLELCPEALTKGYLD
ncbi:MAG: tetratricopeptide repeat protein [Paludibacteraceae bacterium]|nr:tetratricopeptide repeat protein [Paludibacteraceae bacterium]